MNLKDIWDDLKTLVIPKQKNYTKIDQSAYFNRFKGREKANPNVLDEDCVFLDSYCGGACRVFRFASKGGSNLSVCNFVYWRYLVAWMGFGEQR